jgi:RimJ/RimL family protein N-acetyltransferase
MLGSSEPTRLPMSDAIDPDRTLPNWTARPRPERPELSGRYARLAPLAADDAAALHDGFAADTSGRIWDWMAVGPFASAENYGQWTAGAAQSADPLFFTLYDLDQAPATPRGVMSLMRIDAGNGVVEVGNIIFAPSLQRRRATTEAQFLLMRYAFDTLGYRRYEWKCNTLNTPSRAAALRLGFSFEGIFRNHMVIKGKNRDTAWFGLTVEDWPRARAGFEAWLAPVNFTPEGHQIRTLEACRAAP